MSETCPCNDAELLSRVEGVEALPQLLGALASRKPVDLNEFVDVARPAGADLARVIRAQPGTEWDSEGRLVGFGITTRPTAYRFVVGDKILYTWCAHDTLLFTVVLGKATVAESTCPETGQTIRIEMNPEGIVSVSPPQAVVSQRHLDDLVDNLRAEICDHGHFFASPSAAEEWLAEHPDGAVVSVKDAFAECRAACEQLGWTHSEVSSR